MLTPDSLWRTLRQEDHLESEKKNQNLYRKQIKVILDYNLPKHQGKLFLATLCRQGVKIYTKHKTCVSRPAVKAKK